MANMIHPYEEDFGPYDPQEDTIACTYDSTKEAEEALLARIDAREKKI